MTLTLYYHPLASYCWKALIALYERDTPFERRIVDLADDAQRRELSALWPLDEAKPFFADYPFAHAIAARFR